MDAYPDGELGLKFLPFRVFRVFRVFRGLNCRIQVQWPGTKLSLGTVLTLPPTLTRSSPKAWNTRTCRA